MSNLAFGYVSFNPDFNQRAATRITFPPENQTEQHQPGRFEPLQTESPAELRLVVTQYLITMRHFLHVGAVNQTNGKLVRGQLRRGRGPRDR